MESRRLTPINPLWWFGGRIITTIVVSFLLLLLVWILVILLFKVIFVVFNSYFLSGSDVNLIGKVVGMVAAVSFGRKKLKETGETTEIVNNHIGIIKFMGYTSFFRKSFLTHGRFAEFTVFSGKLFGIDTIKLLNKPTGNTVRDITTNDGVPVQIHYTKWRNVVDHTQAHKIEAEDGKEAPDEYINEKLDGIFRSIVNKLSVDQIDITTQKDELQYLLNLAILKNPSFFLPQESIDRLYIPREIDYAKLSEEKRKHIEDLKLTDKDREFVESDEDNPNLVFYFPRIGSNISITIQQGIASDPETLKARAEAVNQAARNEGKRKELNFKLEMLEKIKQELKKHFKGDKTVNNQMILRVALLITDEYKEEKLIDFAGIGGLEGLIPVAKNLLSKIK